MQTQTAPTFLRAHEIAMASTTARRPPDLGPLEALLRGRQATAQELVRAVDGHPGLRARMVRLARSQPFGATGRISMRAAAEFLGLTLFRQLALTSVLHEHAEEVAPRLSLAEAKLLSDSIRVAVIARSLALETRLADPNTAFAAGLIHDIGRLQLLHALGTPYALYIFEEPSPADELRDEVAMAGTHHQEVGSFTCHDWGVPAQLARVVEDHHDGATEALSTLVWTGARLLRASHREAPEALEAGEAAERALAHLGIGPERWRRLHELAHGQCADIFLRFGSLTT
ncbi:MAG TPA: HDOD domain-containing protein [Candidatus Limnocylindrales bacterium]|nr:HDOD domain-containing protein [Candidatus Limnocylindrales bacterium]